ncbi:MAG: protein-L-isoaspartate(D-aspartate) O-methyltransferase, partial [bacterium]
DFRKARREMVTYQIEGRGIKNKRVLRALSMVPRHLFVPLAYRSEAYEDYPLPIAAGQTVSQPYIVALMTELLNPEPDKRILEIGTGSGYQAAVLAELAGKVYTMEIIPGLARSAKKRLQEMGYRNIEFRTGDGYRGWPEAAPFDGIIVTAAPAEIPEPLIRQLKVGGVLVIPVGRGFQNLVVVKKDKRGITRRRVLPVAFVPMTGQAQKTIILEKK